MAGTPLRCIKDSFAILITNVTELQKWQESAKDKAWKPREGIWSEIFFSKYISSNGKVKCSSDGLSHWLYYRFFILSLWVNDSYTRKDQNFYMGTINYFNGMSVCKESPFGSCNHEPVILLVYIFPPSSIKETKLKMPYSMRLSRWILPTQLNLGSHTELFIKQNF